MYIGVCADVAAGQIGLVYLYICMYIYMYTHIHIGVCADVAAGQIGVMYQAL